MPAPAQRYGALFDTQLSIADATQIELDYLRGLNIIDSQQYLGIADHPLHGFIEAIYIDEKSIGKTAGSDTDRSNSLLKCREFGKELSNFCRKPEPRLHDHVATVD
ncbi:hypothetical protein R2B70_12360 [Aeromonas sp. XH]|uniref:hypothetical protein n=1 Tax=Aeromonas sp. XH TaxID=3081770 RepID=UPI0029666974|nr:hypothetical protein [Aeromonas sp. XH]WOX47019.1 hypothetical protein R2B70_12360 [Aeromonas sp. XH]